MNVDFQKIAHRRYNSCDIINELDEFFSDGIEDDEILGMSVTVHEYNPYSGMKVSEYLCENQFVGMIPVDIKADNSDGFDIKIFDMFKPLELISNDYGNELIKRVGEYLREKTELYQCITDVITSTLDHALGNLGDLVKLFYFKTNYETITIFLEFEGPLELIEQTLEEEE